MEKGTEGKLCAIVRTKEKIKCVLEDIGKKTLLRFGDEKVEIEV